MSLISELKFIVDHNVGKLTKWLRMVGYDTLFFNGPDDSDMIATAIAERRVILTRDGEIMKRRVVTNRKLKAIHIKSERPEQQMRQAIKALNLDCDYRPFTICIECNQPLGVRAKEAVKDRVPPYVFQTQQEYMECPSCHRIYWKGTHWQDMIKKIKEFTRVDHGVEY